MPSESGASVRLSASSETRWCNSVRALLSREVSWGKKLAFIVRRFRQGYLFARRKRLFRATPAGQRVQRPLCRYEIDDWMPSVECVDHRFQPCRGVIDATLKCQNQCEPCCGTKLEESRLLP